MTIKHLACMAFLCAVAAQLSQAAPILTVTPTGLNGSGNREWDVEIAPNAALPGSLAVELAFGIDETDLLGVDVNTVVWDFENPGNNPFTGTVTDGLWLDLIGDRTFGAFGSMILTSPEPARLFTIETLGGGDTTIRYGTAASGDPNKGNIIAQHSETFFYTGSVSIPEPAASLLAMVAAAALTLSLRRRLVV